MSITKRRQDICYKVKRHRVMERKIENKRERQRGKRGKEMERKREGERKRRIGKEKERKRPSSSLTQSNWSCARAT